MVRAHAVTLACCALAFAPLLFGCRDRPSSGGNIAPKTARPRRERALSPDAGGEVYDVDADLKELVGLAGPGGPLAPVGPVGGDVTIGVVAAATGSELPKDAKEVIARIDSRCAAATRKRCTTTRPRTHRGRHDQGR